MLEAADLIAPHARGRRRGIRFFSAGPRIRGWRTSSISWRSMLQPRQLMSAIDDPGSVELYIHK
jgi:hypothetical protein